MPVWVLILLMALAAATIAWRLGSAWWKYRGRRVIICPENLRPAGVVVDAAHASATGLGGAPELRLSTCSRWPEKASCGQKCLAQIHAAPDECLVRSIVSRWLSGKRCVNCGQTFRAIAWAGSPPALLGADKKSVEWGSISADRIFEVLATSEAVCFACHTAITLLREHPELVINRHRTHD
jgi:hypothetical protein